MSEAPLHSSPSATPKSGDELPVTNAAKPGEPIGAQRPITTEQHLVSALELQRLHSGEVPRPLKRLIQSEARHGIRWLVAASVFVTGLAGVYAYSEQSLSNQSSTSEESSGSEQSPHTDELASVAVSGAALATASPATVETHPAKTPAAAFNPGSDDSPSLAHSPELEHSTAGSSVADERPPRASAEPTKQPPPSAEAVPPAPASVAPTKSTLRLQERQRAKAPVPGSAVLSERAPH
jgi:hypothetical protein